MTLFQCSALPRTLKKQNSISLGLNTHQSSNIFTPIGVALQLIRLLKKYIIIFGLSAMKFKNLPSRNTPTVCTMEKNIATMKACTKGSFIFVGKKNCTTAILCNKGSMVKELSLIWPKILFLWASFATVRKLGNFRSSRKMKNTKDPF